ncbi:MAG: SAM-dependent methyltransferase, partial [Myxococcota bacterium]
MKLPSGHGILRDEEVAELQATFPQGMVLEDFTRFCDSLEVRLGQAYWQDRGGQAFVSREVPNDITNNGAQASRTAEILFRHCADCAQRGTLAEAIRIVELGLGIGLFARLFLLRFRELCQLDNRDFFARLTYYATDFAEHNLRDIERLGTLAEFGEQVRLGVVDAVQPERFQALGSETSEPWSAPIDAFLHNYLYDSLPHSLLLRRNGQWHELYTQSRLLEPWRVREFTGLGLDQLRERLQGGGSEAARVLVPLYSMTQVETSFFPCDLDELPFASHIARFADSVLQPHIDRSLGEGRDVRMWVPWGAMTSFVKCAEYLADDGLILFTDYGVTGPAEVVTAKTYQRYGAGICINLNFPLVDAFIRERGFRLTVPDGDDQLRLHARLATRSECTATHACFAERLGAGDLLRLEALLERAREHADSDVAVADECYQEAHQLFPHNWRVLGEWAHFEYAFVHNRYPALDLLDQAIALNPSCNADLWCERGDILGDLGRIGEAEDAYRRGVEIDPEDARAYYGLARLWADQSLYPQGLADHLEGLGVQTLIGP